MRSDSETDLPYHFRREDFRIILNKRHFVVLAHGRSPPDSDPLPPTMWWTRACVSVHESVDTERRNEGSFGFLTLSQHPFDPQCLDFSRFVLPLFFLLLLLGVEGRKRSS